MPHKTFIRLGIVVISGVLAIELLTVRPLRTEPTERQMRILVSTFRNSGSSDHGWLASGMTDTIINDLARIKDVQVITEVDRKRAVTEMALGKTGMLDDDSVTRLGKLLGANVIFTGSYAVYGKELRIIARLVRVDTGATTNSAKIDGLLEDVAKLQDRVVIDLMRFTQTIVIRDVKPVKFEAEQERTIQSKHRPKPEAYRFYSMGLDARERDPKEAATLFERASHLDPGFTRALERLQEARAQAFRREAEGFDLAKEYELWVKASTRECSLRSIRFFEQQKPEGDHSFFYWIAVGKCFSGLRHAKAIEFGQQALKKYPTGQHYAKIESLVVEAGVERAKFEASAKDPARRSAFHAERMQAQRMWIELFYKERLKSVKATRAKQEALARQRKEMAQDLSAAEQKSLRSFYELVPDTSTDPQCKRLLGIARKFLQNMDSLEKATIAGPRKARVLRMQWVQLRRMKDTVKESCESTDDQRQLSLPPSDN